MCDLRDATLALGEQVVSDAMKSASQFNSATPVLDSWMTKLLWSAAVFNVLAGFGMVIFYHEGYRALGMPKPELALPTQLVGMLVLLFGWGYSLVARDPLLNTNVLRIGWWTKALGSLLAFYHFFQGNVPWILPLGVLFADVAWLFPFWIIQQRIDAQAADR